MTMRPKNNNIFLNKHFEIRLPTNASFCNTKMRKLKHKEIRTKRGKMQLTTEWLEQKSCHTYFDIQTHR